MKEAVRKCLEVGGCRLMAHFSLEGAGSGGRPGPPPTAAVATCPLHVGTLRVACRLSPGAHAYGALGISTPSRMVTDRTGHAHFGVCPSSCTVYSWTFPDKLACCGS